MCARGSWLLSWPGKMNRNAALALVRKGRTGLPQAGLSAPGHAFSMPPFPDASTALVAMLRRLDSPGLREIVEIDTSYGVRPGEVRSTKSFRLEFPVDASGRPCPFDLLIEIDSPDFEPQSESRPLPFLRGGIPSPVCSC